MQIVFSSHPKNIISQMIMFATGSDISHASIRFSNTESNWMVEAAKYGIQPGWWNKFKSKNKIVHVFKFKNFDEKKLEEIVDKCLDKMIGKKYDYFGILGFAISIILRKLGFKNIKNIFGSKKMFFCSEFIMRVVEQIEKETKIKIFDGDPELTSPYDLFLKCVNNEYLEDVTLNYE